MFHSLCRHIPAGCLITLCMVAAAASPGCAFGVPGVPVSDGDPVNEGQAPADDTTTGGDTTDPAGDPPAEPSTDPAADIPDNEYCNAVANWDADSAAFEEEVLVLVNARRAAGANCGTHGHFDPAAPLTMNGALRCAARNHSMDMALRDFFDHTNPDGEGPGTRVESAGYDWMSWGENIAWGQTTPQEVVDGWMNSDGHCANIMSAMFTETGIGFYTGSFWTQTFGSPR